MGAIHGHDDKKCAKVGCCIYQGRKNGKEEVKKEKRQNYTNSPFCVTSGPSSVAVSCSETEWSGVSHTS